MKNNTTKISLSNYGYSNYLFTINGELFNISNSAQIKHDKLYRYYMIDDNGKGKRVPIKTIYRKAFNKEFCIDNIQNLPKEEWKNFDTKYFVSNYGRIKSYCGNIAKILKPYIKENGYQIVKIHGKNMYIHFLVALAFCENKYKGQKIEIHHKNRNRADNNALNLQILTPTEHRKIHQKEKTDNEKQLSNV